MENKLKNTEETESFKKYIKIAVIVFAIIEAIILLPLIYFKLVG